MSPAPPRACLQCGHTQQEGEFCEVCGTRMVTQQPPAPPPPASGPPPVVAAGIAGSAPPPSYTPPPSYAPPPAYSPPPSYGAGAYVPPSQAPRGFFSKLFDFSFETFITPSIIKILFILILVVIALGALGMIIVGFTQGVLSGLATLIIAVPIGGFLYILFARVWLEIVVVLFRIEENTSIMAERSGKR